MEPIIKDITDIMEKYFPPELAQEWDNVGLQIGSVNRPVQRILVCLDINEESLTRAVEENVNLIITHHPLLFKAIKCIDTDKPFGRIIERLIKKDITLYSAHTNLDAGQEGLNQILAETLGLQDIEPLDCIKAESYVKLAVYVPTDHIEAVRHAISEAGAGYIGNYSDCSFRVKGTGTFKPQSGTNPFIGTIGQLEEVEEYRLETIVPEKKINTVVSAMQRAHPYEEVAYDLYPLLNQGPGYSLGRKGRLKEAVTLQEFALQVKNRLQINTVRIVGELERSINRVAVVSGSGADFINMVKGQGIDLLVTGDLKYHEARDAEMIDLAVIDAGHQGTEEIMVPYIKNLLDNECRHRGYKVEVIGMKTNQCIKTLNWE